MTEEMVLQRKLIKRQISSYQLLLKMIYDYRTKYPRLTEVPFLRDSERRYISQLHSLDVELNAL